MRPLLIALAVFTACKPADEAPRRGGGEDAVSNVFGPRDVGVPPPSGTIAIAPGREVPPIVDDFDDLDARAAAEDGLETVPDAAAADDAREPTPDAGDEPDADGEGDPADAEPEGLDAAQPEGEAIVTLTPEETARVRAPANERAQEEARRYNRAGLAKHRRLELDAAMRDYRRALESWPGHPFSNYNLACAYALTGQPEEALRHLAILAAIGGKVERERLLSARLDPDFEALHLDPRFRALTGFAPVWVSWSPSRNRRADADRLAKALRAVSVPARATSASWPEEVDGPTLLVRANDPIALRMAREVRAAVTIDDLVADRERPPRGLEERMREDLEAPRPLVLVLPGRPPAPPPEPAPLPTDVDPGVDDRGASPDAAPEDPADAADAPDQAAQVVVGVRGDGRAFADLVGTRLVANEGGVAGTLEFRPTGFFTWELIGADGARTLRRGRYAVRGDTLALTYREDREVPGPDPATPEVSFEENKLTTHPFAVVPDGLSFDGVTYRLR